MTTELLLKQIEDYFQGKTSRRALNRLLEEGNQPSSLPLALLPATVLFARTAVCHITAPCNQGYTDEELKSFLHGARSGGILFYQSISVKEEHLEEKDRVLLESTARFLASGGKEPPKKDNIRHEFLTRRTAKDALSSDLSYLLFIAGSDKRMALTGTKREDLLLRIGMLYDLLSGKAAGIFSVTPFSVSPI